MGQPKREYRGQRDRSGGSGSGDDFGSAVGDRERDRGRDERYVRDDRGDRVDRGARPPTRIFDVSSLAPLPNPTRFRDFRLWVEDWDSNATCQRLDSHSRERSR